MLRTNDIEKEEDNFINIAKDLCQNQESSIVKT